MHILHVVGARPNFTKASPVLRALAPYRNVRQTLVHTGQHYDALMSDIFFQQLDIPQPDVNLGVGSDTHARQTAEVMTRFEPVLLEYKPDGVLVYGDVNSTLAAGLVSAKLGVPVGHVEAGLRSFDRTMPEEINRLLTDQIADLLFTPSADGDDNLKREGVPAAKIRLVGNVIIDTLVRLLEAAEEAWPRTRSIFGIDRYALVTLHRPSNVDDPERLLEMLTALSELAREIPVIFPVHPRTRSRIASIQAPGSTIQNGNIRLSDPLSYLDFLALERRAAFVITDSGGVQEETTLLGVPCLTVRENTERPVTVTMGTNILVGQDMARLLLEAKRILAGHCKQGQIPPLWDGHAAERIAEILVREWQRA